MVASDRFPTGSHRFPRTPATRRDRFPTGSHRFPSTQIPPQRPVPDRFPPVPAKIGLCLHRFPWLGLRRSRNPTGPGASPGGPNTGEAT